MLEAALFTKNFASHFLISDFFDFCISLRQKVAVPAVPITTTLRLQDMCDELSLIYSILKDTWIRTHRAAVASNPACSLVTHLPFSDAT